MARLDAKVSKGKTTKGSRANKENTDSWEADPYAGEQVMEVDSLSLLPATKARPGRLKKASGRLQTSKSPPLPLAENKSSTNVSKPTAVKADLNKPAHITSSKPPATSRTALAQFNTPNSPVISRQDSNDWSFFYSPLPVKLNAPKRHALERVPSTLDIVTIHKPSSSLFNLKAIHQDMHSNNQTERASGKAPKTSGNGTAHASAQALIVKVRSRESKHKTFNKARRQVFASKDMMLIVARFLPGLELVRLSLCSMELQMWLGDPQHRLWQDLCVAAHKKFRVPKRPEDSWKRRFLQSLAICEACEFYGPSGPGAVVACTCCSRQYCGFNPPPGHVRFPSTPSVGPVPPRKVGMCYEQCWTLCWRCNDLISMQNQNGQTGAVCRTCCPPDRDVCEQCRETILLARTKPQWQTRRDEHKVARVLGLNDTMGEFMELEDDNRSVASQRSRYDRAGTLLEESGLESSTIFDPYF